MTTDPSQAKDVLQEWAKSSTVLNSVKISESSLSVGDTSVASSTMISVSDGNTMIQYSAISILLQIQNPAQPLMDYRKKCKQFAVRDIMKSSDKPAIVAFFVPDFQQPAVVLPDTEPDDVPMGEPSQQEVVAGKPESSRRDKDGRSSKHKHRSSKHHDRSSSSKKARKSPSGSAPSLVTNEQLMQHLDTVVDKRSTVPKGETTQKSAIQLALSAQGFGQPVAPHENERARALLANEIPVGNSASILRATTNPNKNFARVLELYAQATSTSGKSGGKHGNKSSSSANSPTKKLRAHLRGKKPIIIVPRGTATVITLQNAHAFLCDAVYQPRDRRSTARGGNKANVQTTFTRNVPGCGLVEFEIMDHPRKLGLDPKQWERIVAVIVTGEEWQFKDWVRGYETPAQLFAKVVGCYIGLEGETKQPKAVGTWNVKKCSLHRDKRGMDSITYKKFWNGVDEFMKIYKPELLPLHVGG